MDFIMKNTPRPSEITPRPPRILFIMRAILLFLILGTLPALAVSGYSQSARLTLNLENATVEDVLSAIERESEFYFTYNLEQIGASRRVSVKANGEEITEVLRKLFPGGEVRYEIKDRHIVLYRGPRSRAIPQTAATAQKRVKIAGVVVDGTGLPIIGANVVEKGTTNGTITDLDGNFTLEIPENALLQVTYIGYLPSDVTPTGKLPLTITLREDVQKLEEVVVVGYGVQKKSDVTGSVSSFNTKALEERPQANVAQALQGTVAGLNINMTGSDAEGAGLSTTIRGSNSITASNQPLMILDGIPFSGSWSEINSNDVLSIEILKDASSAAIYGARGANGVILITTKKGSGGKPTLSYDGFVSFDQAIHIPKLMDGESFWKYKTEALKAANILPVTPDDPEPWMGAITPTEERMHREGRSTDWLDLALRSGLKHQHNVSFSGSAEKTKYYVSLNYTNVKGISVNDKFERIGLRLNLEQELNSWLIFNTNTQLGRYDRSGVKADFSGAYKMNPLAEAYDAEGNLRTSAWEDSSVAFAKNPLSSLNEKNSDITSKVITNNSLDVRFPFLEGLTYKLNTGYTYEHTDYKNYQGRDTYEGLQANGIMEVKSTVNQEWIVENILNYTRQFGKHTLFLTALYSAQSQLTESNTLTGRDFANDIMSYYQPDKAGVLGGDATYVKVNHISQMFRANYSYDSRYLLTLTARRDGYSAFGEKSKFGVFPSVALGWNISNEAFFAGSPLSHIVSSLKYRLSWGMNGNEAVSGYVTLPSLTSYDYLTEDKKPLFGFYPSKLESPELGWETTRSFNTGIDYSLLAGRIYGTLDLYWSRTSDLLLEKTIPNVNGASKIIENIGETKNNGIELQISSVNVRTKKFSWATDFNISHYRSKIVNVGLYDENGRPADDLASERFIGYPVNVNYDYVIDGIWQIADPKNAAGQQDPAYRYSIPGNVKYVDTDGQNDITPEDKQIIGSTIPKFTAGLNNRFSYGDFTFSFFLNSSYGITARNYLLDVGDLSWRQNQLQKEYWTPENPINTYPKNDLNGSVNPLKAGFYEKAHFLRLQDVTLAYRLPETATRAVSLKRLEVYLNIKNLATWTSWSGLDPEFISSAGRQRATPNTRSFVVGLRFAL